ncbi:MAG: hypothetical protein K2N03_06810 [Muribaculaceae bacterium]|nr:hypothetical protein [Muribaculaceae bacterium]
MMKLRVTGFESRQIFVIRLCSNGAMSYDTGPAIDKPAGLGISDKFDEFPNQL